MLYFPFDPAKAREATALLLSLAPANTLTRFQILKLLYLSERESLRLYEHPICGGTYSGLPNGPILSEVYTLIKDDVGGAYAEKLQTSEWKTHIGTDGPWNVVLKSAPPRRRLSKADEAVLRGTMALHGTKTYEELWNYVHNPDNVPEYENPVKQNQKRLDIELAALLHALGMTPEDVRCVADDVREARHIRSILRTH
jgi:hypothetical protein